MAPKTAKKESITRIRWTAEEWQVVLKELMRLNPAVNFEDTSVYGKLFCSHVLQAQLKLPESRQRTHISSVQPTARLMGATITALQEAHKALKQPAPVPELKETARKLPVMKEKPLALVQKTAEPMMHDIVDAFVTRILFKVTEKMEQRLQAMVDASVEKALDTYTRPKGSTADLFAQVGRRAHGQ